jgi:hypothetical protein
VSSILSAAPVAGSQIVLAAGGRLDRSARGDERDAVEALLALGADRTLRDTLHGGDPAGWAEFSCNTQLAALLRTRQP